MCAQPLLLAGGGVFAPAVMAAEIAGSGGAFTVPGLLLAGGGLLAGLLVGRLAARKPPPAPAPAQPEAPASSASVEPFKVPPFWVSWCATHTPALVPNLEDVAQRFAQHIGTKAPTLEAWRQFCKDAARQLHTKPVAA